MKHKYVIEKQIKELGIKSSVVAEVSGAKIDDHNPELEGIKIEAAERILKMSDGEIAENSVLEGYRELVRSVGRSLKKFPPSGESLLLQVKRTGCLPTINTAVDSYNIVVSRRFLALGVHDANKIGDTITFRLSNGGESFIPVGSPNIKTIQPGDYVYADDKRVLAWLDSKDSDEVKISTETTDFIIVIQGTARTERKYNLETAEEACNLITRFCGGTVEIFPID